MKFSLRNSIRWSVFIFIFTFILACVFSVSSTTVLEGVGWGIGVLIVFFLVLVGILFDMMGIASAAAQEKPYHAMAAERVKGARHAIHIVRNADRFSSICNDVVGDVAGIISGAASTLVVIKFLASIDQNGAVVTTVVTVGFTAFVSALTVGGKAMGKSMAIHYSNRIVLIVGKCFYFLEERLKIRIFQVRKAKSGNGRRGKTHAAGKRESTR
ncbi:DUF21 domain-containing protein [Xylanibacillus composti]|nr:DUF21 domain-containing protein [Xylanibacillus composti]